ncbi:hypothetical protein KP509_33G020500 [Ceratopteris richardii]|uniref:Uncharacterized protein n=1 Tax=Ceratopteris richardii TaxID=49495 RepID=A0A8T2QMY0_CERRI|nr:hypothetical protein KP509_33G020500 [Ceratopteris richardii]
MAEAGSSSNSGIASASPSFSASAAPDWEVLTASMSSSAIAKPNEDAIDDVSQKTGPEIESSSNPIPDDGSLTSGVWSSSVYPSVDREINNGAEAEPFTEGWKPQITVTSANFYGYVAERNRGDAVLLSRESVQTYFNDENFSLDITDSLLSSKEFDGSKGKIFSEPDNPAYEAPIEDVHSKERNKVKGEKQTRRSLKFICSIAVAVSVVGIVLLGHKLRTVYQQNEQLQTQISVKDEKLNELLLQVKRLKEVLGNQRAPVSK